METPKRLLRFFLLLFLPIFLFFTSIESAGDIYDDFLRCIESQNSNSISQIVFTAKNSSYVFILQSSANNLRPLSTSPFKPKIILTPVYESQIQAAIYCAKKCGIQIRARSGGHDYEGLSYYSEIPFVIVDLRNLSSISIDKENHIAKIQAGATLGELYHKIAEESRTLAFVAGACPTVGVGGHFSGGGYSMMSRRFGIAADHIIDARIIDVNGRILDRQSMGEDLFWAIRGGGGTSFGIIIEWTVKLLTIPENVTVFNVSRILEQNATQLVHRWQYIADKIDENLLIRIFINRAISPESQKRTIEVSFTSLFVGGVDDLLKLMHESFPELGLRKEDCQEMRWIQSILYFAHLPIGEPDALLSRTPLGRSYFKGKSDYVQQPISENGLEGIWKMLLEEDVGRAELQFSPYGGRLNDVSESAIPFPHRAGNIFMIHYVVRWSKEENAESRRHINWIRRLYSYMAKYVSKSPRAAYFNYRDLDLGVNNIVGNTSYRQARVWGAKYFKNNFDRLVHINWIRSKEENAESERHINWIRRLYSCMAKYVSKSPWAAYFNYRDLDLGVNNIVGNTSYRQARVWGAKYFKNNFDRLVHVKTQVDPSNFFRNEQSIPPLA